MNGLTALLAAVVVIVAVGAILYRAACGQSKTTVPFTAGFTAVLLVLSVGVYAALGRWSDYDVRKTDEDAGYMLTAKITQAQRMVKAMPKNPMALTELAEAYLEAGRYKEAVQTYDQCLESGASRIEVLGKKAYALYYRDGRRMSREVRSVVDEVLKANPLEVRTRMLLGQDAFVNERYQEAIGHWKMLLDSGVAPEQKRALENAIANAEQRARKKD